MLHPMWMVQSIGCGQIAAQGMTHQHLQRQNADREGRRMGESEAGDGMAGMGGARCFQWGMTSRRSHEVRASCSPST